MAVAVGVIGRDLGRVCVRLGWGSRANTIEPTTTSEMMAVMMVARVFELEVCIRLEWRTMMMYDLCKGCNLPGMI